MAAYWFPLKTIRREVPQKKDTHLSKLIFPDAGGKGRELGNGGLGGSKDPSEVREVARKKVSGFHCALTSA